MPEPRSLLMSLEIFSIGSELLDHEVGYFKEFAWKDEHVLWDSKILITGCAFVRIVHKTFCHLAQM